MPILKIENLYKTYGNIVAVDNISFETKDESARRLCHNVRIRANSRQNKNEETEFALANEYRNAILTPKLGEF